MCVCVCVCVYLIQDVAKQVLKIAKGGLERRGFDEAPFLSRLEVIADSGLTQVCGYTHTDTD